MTFARDGHSNNIVLGAGELYVGRIENGVLQGERYIGDSLSAELSLESERLEVAAGDGPVRTIESVVTSATRTLNFQLRDLSLDNLALLVGGQVADLAAENAPVADEALSVNRGYWYQLGMDSERPMGIGAVTPAGFALKLSGTSQVIAAEGNYLLDAAQGRIQILPAAAAIQDGASLLVSYTPAVVASKLLKADTQTIEASVRYIEQPRAGTGRNLYMPKTEIRPNGALAFKGDAEQKISLQAVTTEAIYLDGKEA